MHFFLTKKVVYIFVSRAGVVVVVLAGVVVVVLAVVVECGWL